MATTNRIKVMVSSRCATEIKKADGSAATLTDVRLEFKERAEQAQLFGRNVFEVWVSEKPEAPSALDSSWEECMERVREHHFVIVLYTGEAGSAKPGGGIGICHAELRTAVDEEPGKVFIINATKALVPRSSLPTAERKRNNDFINYVERIDRFYETAANYEEILEKCETVLSKAVVRFVDLGKRECRRGKYTSGTALDWYRMNYEQRKSVIEKTIVKRLTESGGARKTRRSVHLQIGGDDALIVCHGVPAGMGVAAARELVGQPFLRDHEYVKNLGTKVGGPIHLIGIHKGVTESQARKQLGFPDAIIVEAPFGIYVADKVQKIQMIFLENCRDETSTRHNIQRFLDWIRETGETEFIRQRSVSRRKIVDLIREEREKD